MTGECGTEDRQDSGAGGASASGERKLQKKCSCCCCIFLILGGKWNSKNVQNISNYPDPKKNQKLKQMFKEECFNLCI